MKTRTTAPHPPTAWPCPYFCLLTVCAAPVHGDDPLADSWYRYSTLNEQTGVVEMWAVPPAAAADDDRPKVDTVSAPELRSAAMSPALPEDRRSLPDPYARNRKYRNSVQPPPKAPGKGAASDRDFYFDHRTGRGSASRFS